MALFGPMAIWITAGLDARHHWSDRLSGFAQVGGVVLAALGYCIVSWAMRSNRFFSAVVVPCIQFVLFVGGALNKEFCFAANPLHPILVTDYSDDVERRPRETHSIGRAAQKSRATKP